MEEQKTWRESVKKYLKIMAKILGGILLSVLVYFAYIYVQIERGELVKWNGEWYTNEEMKEKFPPQYGVTPSQNDPEEVYAAFRQALLNNNLELALEQIVPQERGRYMVMSKDQDRFNSWIQSLPEEIKNGRIIENSAYYDWNKGDGYEHTIDFSKDYTGYWKIDKI